jgi:hypothetical protein
LVYQASLRGKYLLRSAQLEYLIDEVIAHHFCRDEKQHHILRSLVLIRTSISRKVTILTKILNTYDNDHIRKARKLLPNLKEISEFRNKIAHSMPYTDSNYFRKVSDQPLHLVTYEDGKQAKLTISREKFEEKLREVSDAVKILAIIDIYVTIANGMIPLKSKDEARKGVIEKIKGYY